jgi:uncharacterized protein
VTGALRWQRIAGPAGPLEVLHRLPARAAPQGGAVLVCHPHPLYGGTMHSRVVFHLARAFLETGLATLRFNFRGAGGSAGVHDEGRGELEDARAALAHLEALHPREALQVAGHSFGAWIALRLGAEDGRVGRMVAVGAPIRLYDFGFLAATHKQVLLVQGEEDRFGSGDEVTALAASLGSHVRAAVVPGADHFLRGHLDAMRALVQDAPVPPRGETAPRRGP